MRFKAVIQILKYGLWGMFLSACSRQATVPTAPLNFAASQLPGIDSLITPPQLNLTFFQPEEIDFFQFQADIDEDFTDFEKNVVKVKDERLFAKHKDLLIDFGQLATSEFTFPLPGAKVISGYGTRHGRSHTGIDLKTFANDTVRAAFGGVVRVSNRGRGYGNVIVIRHYNGTETVYSHNSVNLAKSGDRVVAGTPIALTGRTGRATTEHVHFEIRVNGNPIDPNLVIDFTARTLRSECLVFSPTEKGSVKINQF